MNENFDKLLNKLKILAEAVNERDDIDNSSYDKLLELKEKIKNIFGKTHINYNFSIVLTKNLVLEIERDNVQFNVEGILDNPEIEKIGVSNYILKELKNIDFHDLEKTVKEYLKENERIKGELDE